MGWCDCMAEEAAKEDELEDPDPAREDCKVEDDDPKKDPCKQPPVGVEEGGDEPEQPRPDAGGGAFPPDEDEDEGEDGDGGGATGGDGIIAKDPCGVGEYEDPDVGCRVVECHPDNPDWDKAKCCDPDDPKRYDADMCEGWLCDPDNPAYDEEICCDPESEWYDAERCGEEPEEVEEPPDDDEDVDVDAPPEIPGLCDPESVEYDQTYEWSPDARECKKRKDPPEDEENPVVIDPEEPIPGLDPEIPPATTVPGDDEEEMDPEEDIPGGGELFDDPKIGTECEEGEMLDPSYEWDEAKKECRKKDDPDDIADDLPPGVPPTHTDVGGFDRVPCETGMYWDRDLGICKVVECFPGGPNWSKEKCCDAADPSRYDAGLCEEVNSTGFNPDDDEEETGGNGVPPNPNPPKDDEPVEPVVPDGEPPGPPPVAEPVEPVVPSGEPPGPPPVSAPLSKCSEYINTGGALIVPNDEEIKMFSFINAYRASKAWPAWVHSAGLYRSAVNTAAYRDAGGAESYDAVRFGSFDVMMRYFGFWGGAQARNQSVKLKQSDAEFIWDRTLNSAFGLTDSIKEWPGTVEAAVAVVGKTWTWVAAKKNECQEDEEPEEEEGVPEPPPPTGEPTGPPPVTEIPCYDDEGKVIPCPDPDGPGVIEPPPLEEGVIPIGSRDPDPDDDWDDDGVKDVDDPDDDDDGVKDVDDPEPNFPKNDYVPDNDVVPEEKPQFFDVEATGKRFAFILDHSGSMQWGHIDKQKPVPPLPSRWAVVLDQVTKLLTLLPPDSEVWFGCFSGPWDYREAPKGPIPGWAEDVYWKEKQWTPVSETAGIVAWLWSVVCDSSTAPREVIKKCWRLDPLPDTIFFLTDGEWTDGGYSARAQWNGFLNTVKKAGKLPPKVHTYTVFTDSKTAKSEMAAIAGATNVAFGLKRWWKPGDSDDDGCRYTHVTW